MAYTTIEKDGEPWMLFHSVHDTRLAQQIAAVQAENPGASITYRLSTPLESQRCTDAMDARPEVADDPFAFFAVKVSDLTT